MVAEHHDFIDKRQNELTATEIRCFAVAHTLKLIFFREQNADW